MPKMTYEQFRKANPICEHPVTGKFGWRRTDGILDSEYATFETEDEAADDRAEYYEMHSDELTQ